MKLIDLFRLNEGKDFIYFKDLKEIEKISTAELFKKKPKANTGIVVSGWGVNSTQFLVCEIKRVYNGDVVYQTYSGNNTNINNKIAFVRSRRESIFGDGIDLFFSKKIKDFVSRDRENNITVAFINNFEKFMTINDVVVYAQHQKYNTRS